MGIGSHEDLKVWQVALQLASDIDALASRLPQRELYGLAAQMRGGGNLQRTQRRP